MTDPARTQAKQELRAYFKGAPGESNYIEWCLGWLERALTAPRQAAFQVGAAQQRTADALIAKSCLDTRWDPAWRLGANAAATAIRTAPLVTETDA